MSIPISQLSDGGLPNGDVEFPATNPLDTTQSINGTTYKYYLVDVLQYILNAQGFTTYTNCRVATVGALTAAYNNGTAGVGATLTNSGAQAVLAIDGITLVVGDRVLVKNQINTFENGIYVVSNIGSASTNWVLTRATDYNEPAEIVYLGVVAITQGLINAGLVFQENSSGPFVIGTSPITFQQLQIDITLLPSASPANKILRSDGTYWVQSTNASLDSTDKLYDLSELQVDNININGNIISSTDVGGNIVITPNTVGSIVLDGLNWPQVDGTASQAIVTDGAGQLSWASFGAPYTPSALTRIDDTNVTLTLGGTPNIALLQAVSMTLGWSGLLSIARGGTNNNVLGASGTLAQSDGTKYSWTTATYPSVATSANRLLRADGTNWVASTNTELTATDELSGLTKLDVDNLELNGNTISSTDVNGDLILTPNGTGDLVLDGLNWPQADGSAGQAVTTNGLGQLGWTSFGAPYTPAALTSVSDSNVTITLGGTPATALLQASSITMGWSGLLPISRGGTNTSTLGSSGQLAQSDGTKYAWTTATYPATATATGTILRADGTNWVATTATYPATTSINHILYSSASNDIGEIADAVGGVLVSNATGVPSMLANPADNYRVLMSKNADKPVWSTAAYPNTAPASGTLMQSDGTDWTHTQATYPSSTNKDHILYSSANNTVGEIGTQKNAVLVSDNSNTPQWSAGLNDGQIIIGKTNDLPAAASITGSGSITVTPGANSITISSSASGTVNNGTANQLAYYATTGTAVSGLTSANSATLVTNGSGVPAWTSSMTNGQVLIGSTGGAPVPALITGTAGITVTPGAGSITISGGGGGYTWTEVTGTTQTMAANSGYITNNPALVTLTLPTTAALGTTLSIAGKGAGGWKIAQNAGQEIFFGSSATTIGATGYLASTQQFDSIELLCITADTQWTVITGPLGAITVA